MYDIHIKFNDAHIPGSPFRVHISPDSGVARNVTVHSLKDRGLQVQPGLCQTFTFSRIWNRWKAKLKWHLTYVIQAYSFVRLNPKLRITFKQIKIAHPWRFAVAVFYYILKVHCMYKFHCRSTKLALSRYPTMAPKELWTPACAHLLVVTKTASYKKWTKDSMVYVLFQRRTESITWTSSWMIIISQTVHSPLWLDPWQLTLPWCLLMEMA